MQAINKQKNKKETQKRVVKKAVFQILRFNTKAYGVIFWIRKRTYLFRWS